MLAPFTAPSPPCFVPPLTATGHAAGLHLHHHQPLGSLPSSSFTAPCLVSHRCSAFHLPCLPFSFCLLQGTLLASAAFTDPCDGPRWVVFPLTSKPHRTPLQRWRESPLTA